MGKLTEGPEFPAPLAFVVPGLCVLTMTHLMGGSTCLIHSLGPPRSTFFGGSKANSAGNGIGFQFFHKIFVRAFYEPLSDNSIKKSFKKENINRAILILSFELKCQLLFDLQVCSQIPGGLQDPSRGSTRQK